MHKFSTSYLAYFILFGTMTANAATVLVTNLLDDGSPGSLRETIANASGSDVIKFSVAGTILLDETLGELVVDKELTIDGQYKITVDGQHQINIGFHVTGASASNSIIQNITIQNFNGHAIAGSGTGPAELPAYGILIDNNATNCSVIATTITHIHSGIDEQAAGIAVIDYYSPLDVINIINNTIMFISSEDNPAGDSGSVFGILAFAIITQDCTNNAIYNLTSGSAIDSGDVIGIIAGIVGNNCLHNTIYNLTSGPSVDDSGAVLGIAILDSINNNCSFNTIYNLTSGTSATDDSGSIFGISIENTIEGDCSHNTLYGFTSGNAVDNSGSIRGIVVLDSINGQCSLNRITNFTSGNTGDRAGEIVGIDVLFMNGMCSNNIIQQFTIGDAPLGTQIALGRLFGIEVDVLRADCLNNHISDLSANGSFILSIGGILLEAIDNSHLVACNTIERITGNSGSSPFGIQIEEGNAITVKNNTIDSIVGTSGSAHGIFLGSDMGTAGMTFVTNSLIVSNFISNIIGNIFTGFGISIFGNGSIGNDLLNNSIFSINGKAINITDNGVPTDGVVTLQSAVCGKRKLFIQGSLQPAIGFEQSDFLIQFFVSDNNIPPQTMTFLGEQIIKANGTGTEIPFLVELKSCATVFTNQYITATATALPGTEQNNNTSEVSNGIPGCNNQDLICNLAVTTCDVKPPVCPILIAQ